MAACSFFKSCRYDFYMNFIKFEVFVYSVFLRVTLIEKIIQVKNLYILNES
jgi:hypothetical protein